MRAPSVLPLLFTHPTPSIHLNHTPPLTALPTPNHELSQHATQFLKDLVRVIGPLLSSVQLTEVGKTLNSTKNEKLKAEKGKTKKKKSTKPSMSRAMFDDDYDNDYGEYDYGDDDFM